jgi:hypothetical protein
MSLRFETRLIRNRGVALPDVTLNVLLVRLAFRSSRALRLSKKPRFLFMQ